MVWQEEQWEEDLSEFAHIADPLALQGAEVAGDAAVFEVDDAGERLVEQGSHG